MIVSMFLLMGVVFDPNVTQKRLGDGFYEQKLIREQVAALTSDIVWLEAQSVRLSDGSTTQALVPRVYLSPKTGDLAQNGQLFGGAQNTGSLISAREIALTLSGDVNNSGTIAGRRLLDISAKNIENTGLLQGDTAKLRATEDINVVGGQISGGGGR